MKKSDDLSDPVRLYLKQIGEIPLLTAEQEVTLAKRIKAGVEAERAVQQPMAQILSDEQMKEYSEKLGYRVQDGQRAKTQLTEANLRLVVAVAKKYVGQGLLLLDLIQEGNIGLMRAVDKFDHTKGFKFSTYAMWWIRQAITRAIADQARTIRVPVHMVETINKVNKVQRQLVQVLGREPLAEEIAEEMGLPLEKVLEVQKLSQDPVSLELPVGDEENSVLGDFVEDPGTVSAYEAVLHAELVLKATRLLEGLPEQNRDILRYRFGLEDGQLHTLEEASKKFSMNKDKVRQLEALFLNALGA